MYELSSYTQSRMNHGVKFLKILKTHRSCVYKNLASVEYLNLGRSRHIQDESHNGATELRLEEL